MRLIIEARIEGAAAASTSVQVGIIERAEDEPSLSNLGMRLDEARELLRPIRWQSRNGGREIPVILNNNNFAKGSPGRPTLAPGAATGYPS